MSGPHGPHRPLAGIALVVGASACFATLDTTTKAVSVAVPLLMALWFRYCFQAVATTLAVLPRRGMAVWRTRRLPWHVLRGLLLLTSSLLAFASLRYLPVGEFTAIVMITPLAITLLAATVLKEPVSGLRWALVAGGFAGTLIIIRPGAGSFGWAGLLLTVLGLIVGVTSAVLGVSGWDVARLWLWLLGSAMLVLVGVQLLIYWVLLRVLEELSQRDIRSRDEFVG